MNPPLLILNIHYILSDVILVMHLLIAENSKPEWWQNLDYEHAFHFLVSSGTRENVYMNKNCFV